MDRVRVWRDDIRSHTRVNEMSRKKRKGRTIFTTFLWIWIFIIGRLAWKMCCKMDATEWIFTCFLFLSKGKLSHQCEFIKFYGVITSNTIFYFECGFQSIKLLIYVMHVKILWATKFHESVTIWLNKATEVHSEPLFDQLTRIKVTR